MCSADPLSYVALFFRKYLLCHALDALINPARIEDEEAFLPASLRGKKLNPYKEALQHLKLMEEASEGRLFRLDCVKKSFDFLMTIVEEEGDEDYQFVAENRFWLSAATVSAQWLLSDEVQASELHKFIERPPPSLSSSK